MCVGPTLTQSNSPAVPLEPSTLPPLVATTGLDAQDGGPEIDIVDRLNAQTKRLAAKSKSEPGDEDYACLQLVKGGATVRLSEGRRAGREGGRAVDDRLHVGGGGLVRIGVLSIYNQKNEE